MIPNYTKIAKYMKITEYTKVKTNIRQSLLDKALDLRGLHTLTKSKNKLSVFFVLLLLQADKGQERMFLSHLRVKKTLIKNFFNLLPAKEEKLH